MKKLVVTALVAVAVLALSHTEAKANGGRTRTIGFGVSLTYSLKCNWWNHSAPACPTCPMGSGCLPPWCWSGDYAPPTMYGGYFAAYPYGYEPYYGGYGYGGHTQTLPNPNQAGGAGDKGKSEGK